MPSSVATLLPSARESDSVEASTPPTSAPLSEIGDDLKIENTTDDDDNERLMLDLAGVSSTMRDEEERYKAEHKRQEEEEAKKYHARARDTDDDLMQKQLDRLVQKSTIYSKFLLDKLNTQQEASRAAAEKADREQASKKDGTGKNSAKASAGSKKVTCQSTTQGPDKDDDKKDTKAAPKKGARGRPPNKTKHGTLDVSKYFTKKDLSDMAAEGEEEEAEDEGFGAKVTKSARQPDLITGAVMKEYQLQGLEWLVSLYENGLNGILADEMGLGKTLQTIAFIAFLKSKHVHGPFLVAAPLSTLSNWVDEFKRFAPDIPVLLYHGNIQERTQLRNKKLNKKIDEKYPVICTSYEIIMNDTKHLQRLKWKYIIIDEGHRLKNLNSKLIKELKLYGSDNRLLLTGTPLQNNLAELWSLLNFLMPAIFDNLETFEGWFDFSVLQQKDGHNQILQKEAKSKLISSLHQILKPFLLRRVKSDVLLDLPKKREYVLYAPLSKTQQELYLKLTQRDAENFLVQKVLESYRNDAGNTGSTGSGSGSSTPNKHKRKASENLDAQNSLQPPQNGTHKMLRNSRSNKKLRVSYKEESDRAYFRRLEGASEQEFEQPIEENPTQRAIDQAIKEVRSKKMQNVVMQLRLACNSPHLFYWPWHGEEVDETLVSESGKMMLLDRLVPALFKKGHKVLIFSQFTKQLDIIQDWAELLRDWKVCRIDGAVKQEDRREQIKSFNSDPDYKIFLLSTRAGGLGINLAAADTVILFDSDWNPQQDLQAQDRAHRIGQTKPVIVYRLATAGTIEQTLLEKADAKRRLEKLVIQKGKFKSLMTSGNQDDISELMKILNVQDFENINVEARGEKILSDEDLRIIMDRSPAAFERAERGETVESSVFKSVETKKVSEDDLLPSL